VVELNAVAGMLGGLADISAAARLGSAGQTRAIPNVVAALQEFNECVRYLNTRRSSGSILRHDSEAAVQDALYLILRPWIPDLVAETPTEKLANRFTVRDFVSKELRLIVEAKFIRDKQHGKSIAKELHDDIEVYRHDLVCDTIVFFVYDPDSNIPDERELRRTIEQSRVYDGRPLNCILVVKP
jgi:hypothetical protein